MCQHFSAFIKRELLIHVMCLLTGLSDHFRCIFPRENSKAEKSRVSSLRSVSINKIKLIYQSDDKQWENVSVSSSDREMCRNLNCRMGICRRAKANHYSDSQAATTKEEASDEEEAQKSLKWEKSSKKKENFNGTAVKNGPKYTARVLCILASLILQPAALLALISHATHDLDRNNLNCDLLLRDKTRSGRAREKAGAAISRQKFCINYCGAELLGFLRWLSAAMKIPNTAKIIINFRSNHYGAAIKAAEYWFVSRSVLSFFLFLWNKKSNVTCVYFRL